MAYSLRMELPVPSEADEERFRRERMSAFIIGYTGATGMELVKALDQKKVFSKVVLIGRRKAELSVGPEFEQRVINMDDPEEHKQAAQGCDVGFCCLGTTRAAAGKEGFIKVDKDYVLYNAEAAKSSGCKSYSVITAMGSNANSCFLYGRIKGEVEEACKGISFDRCFIIRPAGIDAPHPGRLGETCVRWVMKPITACCPTWISIPPRVMAMAMVNANISSFANNFPTPQEMTIENRELHRLSAINLGGCC